MDKKIYDIKPEDLQNHAIWVFPMDESVDDEQTIRPLEYQHVDLMADKIIVRSKYLTANGIKCEGYIYWRVDHGIDSLQPVLFLGDNTCITFWEAMDKPDWSGYQIECSELKKLFPIHFLSEEFGRIESITGKIEGLYYIDETDKVCCIKP